MTVIRWVYRDRLDFCEDHLVSLLKWRARVHGLNRHSSFDRNLKWYNPDTTTEALLPADGRPDRDYEWKMTEAVWAAVEWTRPIYYRRETDQDGTVTFTKHTAEAEAGLSPKPTWVELVRWMEVFDLHEPLGESWAERLDAAALYPRQAKDDFLSRPIPSDLTDAGVHLGTGLDQAPAMIFNAYHGTLAGSVHARSVLRDGADEPVDVWTQADKDALLSSRAELANHAESARNKLEIRLRSLMAVWTHPRGKLGETATAEEIHNARIEAHKEFVAYIQPDNLDRELLRMVGDLQAETEIPADLDKHKELLIERLEAAAMERTKYLMKAATQQGIDRGFSCSDEESAVRAVARECVLGSQEIEVAADAAGSISAYNAAVASIDAIEAENAPAWTIDGEAWTPGTVGQVSGSTATLRAENPALDPPIPGRVTIKALGPATDDAGEEVEGVTVNILTPGAGELFQEAEVSLPADRSDPATVALKAVSICGPSIIKATLTPQ